MNMAPISSFLSNKSGNTTIQFAIIIGVVAVISGIMVPIAMESNLRLIAFERQNVDTIVTGSVKKGKRYRIRKSILDANP